MSDITPKIMAMRDKDGTRRMMAHSLMYYSDYGTESEQILAGEVLELRGKLADLEGLVKLTVDGAKDAAAVFNSKVADLESQLAAAQARIAELDPPWVAGRDPEADAEYEITVISSWCPTPFAIREHWSVRNRWLHRYSDDCVLAWRPIPPVTPWKGE